LKKEPQDVGDWIFEQGVVNDLSRLISNTWLRLIYSIKPRGIFTPVNPDPKIKLMSF